MQRRQALLIAATLLASQGAIGAGETTCTTIRLNGDHPLASACPDGTCGIYRVNYPATTDLGFGSADPDAISFEFYKPGGTPDLGLFDLASAVNANYATCEQCILISRDFVAAAPTKLFFQTSGILKVDGPAAPGVAPDLSLVWSNLHLAEVTIDPVTFESTLVPNGECYDVLPEVIFADGLEPSGYDPAHCAAVANTLDIYWQEVDGFTCSGIEHTDGSLADTVDGSFSMNGVSVTDNCLAPAAYSFKLSPDKDSLYGSDTASSVPMTLTLSNDAACFVGHWRYGPYDFTAAIWNFAGQKLPQTIEFTSTAPANAKVGGPSYEVTATATSGLGVTLTSGSGACTVSGPQGTSTVSFVNVGTCTINADQDGDATWSPAPRVTQSFAVGKADQTISFNSSAPAYGSATAAAMPHTYSATATASSGLPVVFSVAGACTNVGGTVTFGPSAGTCTVKANQAGNSLYNAAPQVTQIITVELLPSAAADSHAVTGNVGISVAAPGVAANDSGSNLVIKSYGANTGSEQATIGIAAATAQSGLVSMNASGGYNYSPPANFTGSDSFKYVIGNGIATSTATVTLTVSDRVMVVATSAVGSGDCKPESACTLAAADGNAAIASGKDLVFVKSGSYATAAFSLLANQSLVGQRVALTTALADAGITLATDSVTGPITALGAGTAPSLSNAASVLTLAGGNLVEYFSITNSAGSAIRGNAAGSGTSTIRGISVTDGANGGLGVTLTANLGTLNFSDLAVATSTGDAFSATGGGTVAVTTGTGFNSLSSTTGTALKITNTTIGASGVTFRSISANGGANGIFLNNTGTSGGLSVTGDGANAGSGGTIRNMVGANAATSIPTAGENAGTGIFLYDTSAVSLAWMQINDHQNYAIYGNGVTGFSLSHCVINGSNGNSEGVDEASIAFDNLLGSASMTNSSVSGGREDNLRLRNTTGTLNRLTIDAVTWGNNDASTGNAALNMAVQPTSGSATMNVTVKNSTFTGSRSHFVQYLLNNSASPVGDFVFTNNTITQSMTPLPGSGGVLVSNAGSASANPTLTYNIQANTIHSGTQGITGNDIAVAHGSGTGSFSGNIDGNTIGTSGASGSGSTQGSGISITHAGGGTNTVHVTNNTVRRYNNYGITVQVGDNANGGNGTVNATVTGNTVAEPDTFAQHGVYLVYGTTMNDQMSVCSSVGGAGALKNTLTGSGVVANGGVDIRSREQFHVTTRLPGYAGANNDNNAVASFLGTQNTLGSTSVANNVLDGGGGYVGGASCP